ncbi:hypothetical protein THAOC_07338, partial [Thalassiosira oceanica]
EMLLLEPHVAPGEAAVGPPRDIDKGVPSSRPGDARPRAGRGEEVDSCNSAPSPWTGSALALDAYGSGQFRTRPGQWEAANLRAFDDVGLDLRKALVRIEFPVFPEGCGDRTFREVYQLNARVRGGRKESSLRLSFGVPRRLTCNRPQVGLLRDRVPRHAPRHRQEGRDQVRPPEGPAPPGRRGHLRRGSHPLHPPSPVRMPPDRLLRGGRVLLPRHAAHDGGGPVRPDREEESLHRGGREVAQQEDARERQVLSREQRGALRHEAEEPAARDGRRRRFDRARGLRIRDTRLRASEFDEAVRHAILRIPRGAHAIALRPAVGPVVRRRHSVPPPQRRPALLGTVPEGTLPRHSHGQVRLRGGELATRLRAGAGPGPEVARHGPLEPDHGEGGPGEPVDEAAGQPARGEQPNEHEPEAQGFQRQDEAEVVDDRCVDGRQLEAHDGTEQQQREEDVERGCREGSAELPEPTQRGDRRGGRCILNKFPRESRYIIQMSWRNGRIKFSLNFL